MAQRRRFSGFLAFFFLLFSSSVLAGGIGREVRTIDKSCAATDLNVKSGALSTQFFAVLSADHPDTWVEYPTEAALDAASPKGFFRKAQIYFQGTSVLLATMEIKSPAKDWVQYPKYYFREDGTLEKIHMDFKRFGAYERSKGMEQQFLVKVLRDRFYGPEGKCIKKSKPRYFNTDNGREMQDVVFTDVPWPLYGRVEKLPFYSLIQSPTPLPTKH